MSDKERGLRHNTGKPQLSLVLEARLALEGCARAFMYGLSKYFRGNWRKGFDHTQVSDSALRHLVAYQAGENIDKESGLHHVDMALCNMLMLAEMYHGYKQLDDRPIIEGVPNPLMNKPEKKAKAKSSSWVAKQARTRKSNVK